MRHVLINGTTHLVENVIVLDDPSRWPAPAGYYLIASEDAGIGATHDPAADRFVAPPVPNPTPQQVQAAAHRRLEAIDAQSIRGLREWLAAQPGAPDIIKQHEAAAVAARAKLSQ